MNLTDFLHHILILESNKAKSCRREEVDRETRRRGEKERERREKRGEKKKIKHMICRELIQKPLNEQEKQQISVDC